MSKRKKPLRFCTHLLKDAWKMKNNIACRIYAEQIKLLLSLPDKDEAKNVLFQALVNSYNQFEFQNENQNENQFEYVYDSVSVYDSLSPLSISILELLSKNIIWREFSNNYGGRRERAGRKKTKQTKTPPIAEKKKLTRNDVVDWETLFKYWEQNKGGKKYANDESRADMLNRLRKLTKDNFEYAKVAIYEAINHGWQGFCGVDGLYYKGAIPSAKPKRPVDVDEHRQLDGTVVWYDFRENKVLDIPFVANEEPDWSRWDETKRAMR